MSTARQWELAPTPPRQDIPIWSPRPAPLCTCSDKISVGSRIFAWHWPLPLSETAPTGKYTRASWSVVACRAQTYQSVYSMGGLDACRPTFISVTGTVLASTPKLNYISDGGAIPRVRHASALASKSTYLHYRRHIRPPCPTPPTPQGREYALLLSPFSPVTPFLVVKDTRSLDCK